MNNWKLHVIIVVRPVSFGGNIFFGSVSKVSWCTQSVWHRGQIRFRKKISFWLWPNISNNPTMTDAVKQLSMSLPSIWILLPISVSLKLKRYDEISHTQTNVCGLKLALLFATIIIIHYGNEWWFKRIDDYCLRRKKHTVKKWKMSNWWNEMTIIVYPFLFP